ncbi:MAG: hypothetical protein FJ249_01450 [Nitrospira sp.]|nr:hypothetical protein [Nitrospira sp.]
MTALDEHERLALDQFLGLMEEASFEPRPQVDQRRIFRSPDGQIIVPVTLSAQEPSLHMAMLMAKKAEQLCKQSGCRFVLAQRPEKDPKGRTYVWADEAWQTLSRN